MQRVRRARSGAQQAMQCSAMQCNAVQCNATRRRAGRPAASHLAHGLARHRAQRVLAPEVGVQRRQRGVAVQVDGGVVAGAQPARQRVLGLRGAA